MDDVPLRSMSGRAACSTRVRAARALTTVCSSWATRATPPHRTGRSRTRGARAGARAATFDSAWLTRERASVACTSSQVTRRALLRREDLSEEGWQQDWILASAQNARRRLPTSVPRRPAAGVHCLGTRGPPPPEAVLPFLRELLLWLLWRGRRYALVACTRKLCTIVMGINCIRCRQTHTLCGNAVPSLTSVVLIKQEFCPLQFAFRSVPCKFAAKKGTQSCADFRLFNAAKQSQIRKVRVI